MSVPFWLLAAGALVALFWRYGLATSLLASLTASVAAVAVPLLTVADPSIQLQASLALLVVALPFLVSVRSLASGREFAYRYEDIPPHVRRIAERERQRVELETARRIQSSILPELPPTLNGVEIAHAYLPATEVGGDFYDVLALEDGRLAVAVGDVAGHGVSSGLVMSMAHSALAVQVTFDPESAGGLRHPQPDGLPDRPQAPPRHPLLRPARPDAARAALRQRRPPVPLPHRRRRAGGARWNRSPIRSACAARSR